MGRGVVAVIAEVVQEVPEHRHRLAEINELIDERLQHLQARDGGGTIVICWLPEESR